MKISNLANNIFGQVRDLLTFLLKIKNTLNRSNFLGLEKLLLLVPGVNSIPGILRLTGINLVIHGVLVNMTI